MVFELPHDGRAKKFVPFEHRRQRGAYLVDIVRMAPTVQFSADVADTAWFGKKPVVSQIPDSIPAGLAPRCLRAALRYPRLGQPRFIRERVSSGLNRRPAPQLGLLDDRNKYVQICVLLRLT